MQKITDNIKDYLLNQTQESIFQEINRQENGAFKRHNFKIIFNNRFGWLVCCVLQKITFCFGNIEDVVDCMERKEKLYFITIIE